MTKQKKNYKLLEHDILAKYKLKSPSLTLILYFSSTSRFIKVIKFEG